MGRDLILLLFLAAFGCARLVPGPATVAAPAPGDASGQPAAGAPGLEALRSSVLAYAGRYREKLGFAIDSNMAAAGNAGQRFGLQATKVSYVSAVVHTATGPDPVLAVRDLVVALQLQRIIWDESGRDADFPASAVAAVRAALRDMEQDIHELAAGVVSSGAMEALHREVLSWRAANPEQDYVAFVVLDTPGAERVEKHWNEDARRGGFLAPVNEAARQIAHTRETAERALFLLNQLPMLAEWNTELLVLRALAMPEAARASDYAARMVAVTEKLQGTISALPDRITVERQALLDNFARTLRMERQETLKQITGDAQSLGPLLKDLGLAAVALRDTTATLERMFPPAAAGEMDGMAALQSLVDRTAVLTTQLRGLLGDARPLLDTAGNGKLLATLDEALARHERRIFLYGVALVLLAGFVAIAVAGFARRRSGAS